MDKCGTRQLLFIDNKNINPNMSNKSGLHLNEYGTTCLLKNFCFSMNASRYEICMGAQNTIEMEDPALSKTVNKNLVFNV